MELATPPSEPPCGDRGLEAVCLPVAIDGTDGDKWRRRELNSPSKTQEKPTFLIKAAQNAAHSVQIQVMLREI